MAARPSAPSSPSVGSNLTVPSLNRDPVQSLRPLPVAVTFAHREFVIPALPAADWLTLLMDPDMDLDDVFPGLLGEEDTQEAEKLLYASTLTVGDFRDLVLEVLETASARDWWVALRLVGVATASWDVLGAELALKGVDANRLSLSAWLDVLLVTILRNMDPKDVTMFTLKLESPPPAEQEKVSEEITMSRDAFTSMM